MPTSNCNTLATNTLQCTVHEKSLYACTFFPYFAQQYTLFCSAIYPILVSNIPYIGLQYTLYWFVTTLSLEHHYAVSGRLLLWLLRSKIKIKASFHFVFPSLIRTFGFAESTFARK